MHNALLLKLMLPMPTTLIDVVHYFVLNKQNHMSIRHSSIDWSALLYDILLGFCIFIRRSRVSVGPFTRTLTIPILGKRQAIYIGTRKKVGKRQLIPVLSKRQAGHPLRPSPKQLPSFELRMSRQLISVVTWASLGIIVYRVHTLKHNALYNGAWALLGYWSEN